MVRDLPWTLYYLYDVPYDDGGDDYCHDARNVILLLVVS